MARKTRGPGASNAEASKKNAPLKSSFDSSRTSRRVQRKGSLPRAKAGDRASRRRSYAVYDGQRLLGFLILNEATNLALAWDASRHFVGRFDGHKAGARAIGSAKDDRPLNSEGGRKQPRSTSVEARNRMLDPKPPFATGLPARFLEWR
jgi:hypothetical protein